ncbi:amidohydrolase 2 [Periconia macrospinosa]|uniref:6-methylsalicylate decarboxylase n=1 Tax=Periconia macrospinosa TaxID=97972 RepID=A0A2V1CZZ4_9PLEO|nr:amidohydrolase 2 [Periconia macrospinosa]
MANPLPQRIDVHSHFLPPFYRDALVATNNSKPDGMPAIPPWSPSAHREMMQAVNVRKAILSISSQGTHLWPSDPTARKNLARECNAYAAGMTTTYPGEFGFWASLPLPNVEDALAEIERAREEGADGFGLMTNYHGVYVGDEKLDPVFDRLNEIGATVFLHPDAPCMAGLNASTGVDDAGVTGALPFRDRYPIPIFEFLFDTSRAVINLFYSGTVDRCPNIKFIIPHVGGTLPPLITRFTAFGSLVPGVKPLDGERVRKQMQDQFYFDLAGTIFDGESGGRGQLKAFVEGWDISHEMLLYGSDFPFTNARAAELLANRMKDGLEHLFNEEERRAIYEENGKRLLARTGNDIRREMAVERNQKCTL